MLKIVGSVIYGSGVFLAIFTWGEFSGSEKAIVLMLMGIFIFVLGQKDKSAT